MKKGFSIIELVISVFAFSVIVAAVYSLSEKIFRETDYMYNYRKAVSLAENRIEYLKTLNSDSAVLLNNFFEDFNTIADYNKFRRETYAQTDMNDSGLVKLQVNVMFQTLSGKIETVKLAGMNKYE